MKQHLKKGLKVMIIAGKDKGKSGTVQSCKAEYVVIEGLNMQTRHQKERASGGRGLRQGGIVQVPGPIHRSNLKIQSEE